MSHASTGIVRKSGTPLAKQPTTDDAITINAIWAPVGARAIYFNMSSLVPTPCYGSLNLEVVSAAHNNDVAIGGAGVFAILQSFCYFAAPRN